MKKEFYLIAGGIGLGIAMASIASAYNDKLTIDTANRKKSYEEIALVSALAGAAVLYIGFKGISIN